MKNSNFQVPLDGMYYDDDDSNYYNGGSKSPGNIVRPTNEFSRVYRPDAILTKRQRDYNVEIEAKEDELTALAKRFELHQISNLHAVLALRQEGSYGISTNGSSGGRSGGAGGGEMDWYRMG